MAFGITLKKLTRLMIVFALLPVLIGLLALYQRFNRSYKEIGRLEKPENTISRLRTKGSYRVHMSDAKHTNSSPSNATSAIETQQNSVGIELIRDIATDVKWSADKTFEKDLMQRCAAKKYDISQLPRATVVLCFHGTETLTRLMHTVHSIVQNSPKELLAEVLLIADNSDTESHKTPLENYVKFVFPGLVRIHRSETSLGLIRCRHLGVTLAKGEVAIALDSHMETRVGWLEALLHEIHLNRKTMASPVLDWMHENDDGSWQYEYGCSRYKAVWYWVNMGFTYMEIPDDLKYKIDSTEPIISPVSIGHWAIEKKFFFEIGGLDTGMKLWGGENIDLPIRAVLGGGRHVNVPCAHVAHCAPRGTRDYRLGHRPEVNYKRVIEALFDEQYKEAIYYFNPNWKSLDHGDISERLEIASKLPHKFPYYMEQADMEHLAPNVNTLAWDGIRNVGLSKNTTSSCMYMDFSSWLIKLTNCINFDRHLAGIFLTTQGQLHSSNHIVMSVIVDDSLTIGNYVGVINTSRVDRWMHKKDGTIQWYGNGKYFKKMGSSKPTPKCITIVPSHDRYRVSLRHCNPKDSLQQWTFGKYTNEYQQLTSNYITPQTRDERDSLIFYETYKSYLKNVMQ